jgi:hypothetical protein
LLLLLTAATELKFGINAEGRSLESIADRLPIFGTTTLESVGIAVGEIAAMSELGVK